MDDQMMNVTETSEATQILADTATETNNKVGFGDVAKAIGFYTLAAAAAGGAATLAIRGSNRFCDWLEVKAAGRAAKKEAEKAAKEAQKKKSEEKSVETSPSGEKVLNETK